MTLSPKHAGTAAAEFLFISIYVLTVLYVPTNAAALRLLSLATIAGASWAVGHSLLRLTTVPQWRGAMATLCGIRLLNASEILCVFAVDSWEIKNLAPTRRETRARFLLRRVSLTFLAYLAVEVLVLQPPLGIMTEEAVQSVVPGRLPVFARKVMGYLWVIAFISWSVPVWLYPHLRLGMNAADMLPFHFVSPAIKALTSK